tara:strand:- start:158 stop:643 length:486 start_codon:yes stop_codon:yes gene_type:complete
MNAFGKKVIQQSRSNLTKGKRNSSKTLYNSLGYDLEVFKTGNFSMSFEMEDYGEFQDQGVKGAGGTRNTTSKYNKRNNKGKIWKQKAPNSPFSFKEGKRPSVKHFKKWAESKGINPFAVRESVFRQGITPTQFFSKPFGLAFKNLPSDITDAFMLTQKDLK